VIEFADLFETRVVLLRVLEEKKRKSASPRERPRRRSSSRPWPGRIEKKGVETLSLVEKGDPTEQILKAIRFNDIDLIAMTTHGRSGLRRAVTGSVTENVLRNATVPLLITRNEGAATKGKARRAAKARS
jgi:hypothetical protein